MRMRTIAVLPLKSQIDRRGGSIGMEVRLDGLRAEGELSSVGVMAAVVAHVSTKTAVSPGGYSARVLLSRVENGLGDCNKIADYYR